MNGKTWWKLLVVVVGLSATLTAATRVAYTRPGFMMKIPTSSVERSPYLFPGRVWRRTTQLQSFQYSQGYLFRHGTGEKFHPGLFFGTDCRYHQPGELSCFAVLAPG